MTLNLCLILPIQLPASSETIYNCFGLMLAVTLCIPDNCGRRIDENPRLKPNEMDATLKTSVGISWNDNFLILDKAEIIIGI